MIFPAIFLLISISFGHQILKKFSDIETQEKLLIHGAVFGISIDAAGIYFLSRIFGLTAFSIIIPQAILFSFSIFLYLFQHRIKFEFEKKLSIALTVAALLAIFLFAPIFISHSLKVKGDSLNSGVTEWGDLALHTTLIDFFLNNPNNLSQNPIYSESKLNYPPLMDFTSSAFVFLGSSIQQSLYLPAIILSVLFVLEVFLLTFELTKGILSSFIAVILVLFNGGIGGIYFLQDLTQNHENFFYFLTNLSKDYAKLTDKGIQLGNIIVVSLIPQRTFIMGYTVAIFVIILLVEYFKKKRPASLIFAGILSGILPIIHPHSLIAVAIFISSLALMNFELKTILDFLKYFAPPFLVISSVPLLEILSSIQGSTGFLRIHLFWMADKTNPIIFYFKNLGILLPLLIMSIFFVPKRLLKQYIPFLTIFLVANILIFQPWDYDNTKVLFYFLIGSSIMVSYILAKILKSKYILNKFAAVILIFFAIASGVLSVMYEGFSNYELFNEQGVEFAKKVNSITSSGDIILTSDQHNHPVTAFSGRGIVMGYRGWLWTWGYNYSQRERDVYDIYEGSQNTPDLIKKYSISYIVVGPSELKDFYADQKYFDTHYQMVLNQSGYKLYDAKTFTK